MPSHFHPSFQRVTVGTAVTSWKLGWKTRGSALAWPRTPHPEPRIPATDDHCLRQSHRYRYRYRYRYHPHVTGPGPRPPNR